MASSSILSLSSSHQNLHFQLNQLKGLASTATRTRKNCCNLITRSNLTNNNADLLQAAKHTVDTFIRSGMVIGLGSGHASCLAIQYLGQQLRAGKIKDIVGIPTSVGSASEAAKAGIFLDQYEDSSQVCPNSNFQVTWLNFNWVLLTLHLMMLTSLKKKHLLRSLDVRMRSLSFRRRLF